MKVECKKQKAESLRAAQNHVKEVLHSNERLLVAVLTVVLVFASDLIFLVESFSAL